jgi:hypothetical protein
MVNLNTGMCVLLLAGMILISGHFNLLHADDVLESINEGDHV